MAASAGDHGEAACQAAEWTADAAWRSIDFLSDVHLTASMPRTFNAWSAHMLNTPADAVVILGDLFEVWLGDDTRHDAFERDCAEVLTQTTRHKTVAFLAGNRDFLLGAEMLRDCGLIALADPTVLVAFGSRWLLTHGDALCLTDVDYQRFRSQVRDPRWQGKFLAQPIEERRRLAQHIRAESRLRHDAPDAASVGHDIDVPLAAQWLGQAGAVTLVHGHTHLPGTEPLAPGITRHVLSDWDYDSEAQAPRADVLTLTAQRGLVRRPPTVFGGD